MGNASPLFWPHVRHGLQVVAAVGELDHHDAQVVCHGHQHLAEVFGLRVLVGLKLDLVELGEAINQIGDLRAKAFGNLGFGDGSILHHVVQQRGCDGLSIHAPFGQRAGNGQRMRDIGFARKAGLALVRLFAEVVGVEDGCYLIRVEMVQAVDKNPVGRIVVLIDGASGCALIRRDWPGVVGRGVGRGGGVRIHG